MELPLALPKVYEGSLNPKAKCSVCGELLWTERSNRTGWKQWFVTKGGKHHPKTSCPFKPKERPDEA